MTQAYLFAKALEHYKVIFVGEQADDLARLCHCLSAQDWRDAAELAESLVGHRPRTLIIMRPRFTIPLMGGLALNPELQTDENDDQSHLDTLLQDALAGDAIGSANHDGADWIDDVERLLNTEDH